MTNSRTRFINKASAYEYAKNQDGGEDIRKGNRQNTPGAFFAYQVIKQQWFNGIGY